MNVLTKDVPRLDQNDPKGSLEQIYNYLHEIMEQIDYTLSRQGIQLGKVKLPETAKQVEAAYQAVKQMEEASQTAVKQMETASQTAAKQMFYFLLQWFVFLLSALLACYG